MPTTGALAGGRGGGCKDEKSKRLRRGSQLNSEGDDIRFKGRKKTGETLEI